MNKFERRKHFKKGLTSSVQRPNCMVHYTLIRAMSWGADTAPRDLEQTLVCWALQRLRCLWKVVSEINEFRSKSNIVFPLTQSVLIEFFSKCCFYRGTKYLAVPIVEVCFIMQ